MNFIMNKIKTLKQSRSAVSIDRHLLIDALCAYRDKMYDDEDYGTTDWNQRRMNVEDQICKVYMAE